MHKEHFGGCVLFPIKTHSGGISWEDLNLGVVKLPPYLFVFLQLCVVNLSDLGEFGSVVGMFD